MACQQYINSIHEMVDGTIGSIRRAELELHLAQCDDCRALLEDLRRIHEAAAALPVIEAPDRAWLQIAGRLRQEGRIHEQAPAAPAKRRSVAIWLAAAAAIVIAVGSALVLLMPRTPPATQTASAPAAGGGNAAPAKSVETVQNEVDAAQQQFEKAIAELEKVAKANQQALDPGTSATIEKNLGILDQAIADNRVAVKSEPTSVAARETLFEALRQKVSLLQDTISLINEMRKGNNAAAAQLVNKS
jgi:anti-sigma factor RsiW